jgi:diketogulonate reductase-like aldo/keto reductase
MIQRKIPSSGEPIPAIGLGTWQTFDVADAFAHPALPQVLNQMHLSGARLIDSSPMYGHAEKTVGDLGARSGFQNDFFYATKVWTNGREAGIKQMASSFKKMKRDTMDLMQIHNLTDWKTHLPVLRDWKKKGKIRYIGITHYTDSMHPELEKVFTQEKEIDFVQFNYSIADRHAEKRLLDAAAHKGIATLINRPFGEGSLFRKVKDQPLPAWAKEAEIRNWSDFFLKFILSHPAVTCIIPATSDPLHAKENFEAGKTSLPDEKLREDMIRFFDSIRS